MRLGSLSIGPAASSAATIAVGVPVRILFSELMAAFAMSLVSIVRPAWRFRLGSPRSMKVARAKVFSMSLRLQMLYVHAGTMATGVAATSRSVVAFMVKLQPFGNRTNVAFVGPDVSSHRAPVHPEGSIAVGVQRSGPFDAPISASLSLLPESFVNILGIQTSSGITVPKPSGVVHQAPIFRLPGAATTFHGTDCRVLDEIKSSVSLPAPVVGEAPSTRPLELLAPFDGAFHNQDRTGRTPAMSRRRTA